MAQKSFQSENLGKSLGELPGSENKEFWGDANQYLITGGNINNIEECQHQFTWIGENKVECRFCGFGGFIRPKTKKITLRNGKIFKIFAK